MADIASHLEQIYGGGNAAVVVVVQAAAAAVVAVAFVAVTNFVAAVVALDEAAVTVTVSLTHLAGPPMVHTHTQRLTHEEGGFHVMW